MVGLCLKARNAGIVDAISPKALNRNAAIFISSLIPLSNLIKAD
jgi:hypothetical protein